MPDVRTALIARQRAFRKDPGLVADGRDMGTVIFPDATLKVFLTASVEARAARRHKQLIQKGFSANMEDLLRDLRERDDARQQSHGRAAQARSRCEDCWIPPPCPSTRRSSRCIGWFNAGSRLVKK